MSIADWVAESLWSVVGLILLVSSVIGLGVAVRGLIEDPALRARVRAARRRSP